MSQLISNRYLKDLLLLSLVIMLIPVMLQAQIRGKISGKVTDAQTGEPLPFTNVIVKGTNLGAATDAMGEYFILNLPAGVYKVEARFMGYNSMGRSRPHGTLHCDLGGPDQGTEDPPGRGQKSGHEKRGSCR